MRGRHRRAFRLALASGATALVFAVGGMVAVTLAAGPEDEGDTTTTVEQPAPPPTTSTDADPPVVKISGVIPAYE